MGTTARERWNAFWKEEDGIGTLEMLLIIAVVLVVAIAFRKWIMAWINDLFQNTNDHVTDTLNENTIQLP
ncbi:Flp1 family type IVb pilin [Paenibacillus sp.]|uniref:Flp1 family type IVb pilin n=1 Tax=Paenibacillus sp. TaxID=58172 RepID=UPI002D61AFB3|nr:Flp1 family type IVb pilin [Paenibacillus sp.]HZG56026.1 Flp1 family type IVb pilin [Paenibacillus sp.]